jgi:hypothetical protein
MGSNLFLLIDCYSSIEKYKCGRIDRQTGEIYRQRDRQGERDTDRQTGYIY